MRGGITFKLTVFVSLMVIISIMAFFAVFVTSEAEKIRSDLINNAKIFSEFSVSAIYQDYTNFYTHPNEEDFQKFRESTERIMEMNTDVRIISLLGTNGRVMFDSSEFTTGKYEGAEIRFVGSEITQLLKNDHTTVRDIQLDGDLSGTEIIVPIIEPSIGHLLSMRYIFSHESLSERLMNMHYQTLMISIPMLALAIIAAIFFSFRLTRPIIRLREATAKISGGNLDAKIAVKGTDEIGKLAESFNKMTGDLKKLIEEKKKYSKVLEKRVKERTEQLEKSKQELEKRNDELERFNKLAIGRELKMVELKKKIRNLEGGEEGAEEEQKPAEEKEKKEE